MSFENFEKSWSINDFPNLLNEISNFSNLKAHRNKTTDQNPFKPFLSDRGDQNIKSQEVLHHKYSPSVNNIAKILVHQRFLKSVLHHKYSPLPIPPASNRVN